MPDKAPPVAAWQSHGFAILVTGLALAIRGLFDSQLGERFPFPMIYAAVALAVWFGGWRPALLAVVAGYLATRYFFMEPRGSLALPAARELLGATMYVFSCAVIVVIGELLHRARRQVAGQVIELESAAISGDELREQVAMTLHYIAEAFSRYDRSWVLVYANEEQKRVDPQIAEALTAGRTLWQLWPNIVGTPLEAALRRCMETRVTVEAENHDRESDRWYSVRAYPGPNGGLVMLARDVSDAKRAEQALRKSEDDYRQLFEGSALGKAECSLPGGLLTRVNPRYCELLGYSAAELSRMTIFDITHTEDHPRCKLAAEAAVRSGAGFEMEKRYVRKDGALLWVNIHGVIVRDQGGAITGILASVQDITARREMQEALRLSEARSRCQLIELETLYATAPIGMATCDTGMRFVRMNRALANLAGPVVPRLGQTLREAFPTLADVIEPYFLRVLETRQVLLNCSFEGETPAHPGQRREWRMTAYPLFSASGEVRAVSGIVLDVTARKAAERQSAGAALALAAMHRQLEESFAVLDTLVTSAPIGLSFVDRDFRFVRINEALAAINGAPVVDHTGRTVAEMVPSVWPAVEPMYRQALNGTAVVNVEMPGEVPSTPGQTRYWMVSCYPARVGGSVIGVGTVVVEVTGQRLANQALKDADRRKDEFLATLAHELRNPLAPLRNGLQLLKLSDNKADAFERIRPMMERQLAQVVRLIDDLLDVSRIGQGKIGLHIQRVSLASVIETAVEASRPLIEAGGHTLTVHAPAETSVVDVDPARMTQVLSNLLNNAARYTPQGGTILLTARIHEDMAEVSIQDNGIGVPSHMLGRIFGLFAQVERPEGYMQHHGGLGIGLALVKGLVEIHGGHVEVTSDGDGLGSCFTVRLPVLSAATLPEGVPGPARGFKLPLPKASRVLIADDNEDSCRSLALLLEIMGHEVRQVPDGLQAVAMATSFQPHLILLDIGMPGIDGYEVCRRIRQLPCGQRARVVAMTGWGQDEHLRRSHDAGFDRHLVKPVDPAEIERLLDSIDGTAMPADSPP